MRASMILLVVAGAIVIPRWASVCAAQGQWVPRGASASGPCRDDMEKFCKDVPQGRGQVRQCLQEHLGDLSAGCREHLQGMQKPAAGRGALGTACSADAEKFCKQLQPGRGGLYHCLKGHEADLSDACKSAVTGTPSGGGH